MNDIFISYAKEDRPRASVIAGALEQQGWTVWWDRKIPPGRVFDEVIAEALDTAKCVIVLWSRFSVASDWVKEEASEGARRKVLVPALIDDVPIPLGFKRIEAAQLIAWQTDGGDPEFLQLLESVSQILGTKPKASPPPPAPPIAVRPIRLPPPPQPKKHNAWLRWGAAIATFVVVLVAGWIIGLAVGIALASAMPAESNAGGLGALFGMVLLLVIVSVSSLLAILVWRRLR